MESSQVKTPDGIDWYVERFAPSRPKQSSDPIVLIPSGEGDCGNLQRLGLLLAEAGYHAISFDNPGFSRTTAPKEAYERITPELIARQIIGLLDKLDIKRATFFGNSSGGGAVLSILTLYPARVKCAIVHEVPLEPFPLFADLPSKSDQEISDWCASFFADNFIEQEENDGRKKFDALGPEYLGRLRPNFVTWVRGLVNHYEAETGELVAKNDFAGLKNRPLFWTVGGMSVRAYWAKDFEVAEKAGKEVRTDVVNCLHFPYISVPEKLAGWIGECVESVKD